MCADGQCQRVKPSEDGAAPIVDASTKPAERDDEPNMPTGVKLKGVGASDTSGCGCSIPSRTANAGALTLVAMLVALTRRARRISRAKTAYLRD
jgi:MYXO-CTERM domain-containing protein